MTGGAKEMRSDQIYFPSEETCPRKRSRWYFQYRVMKMRTCEEPKLRLNLGRYAPSEGIRVHFANQIECRRP